MIVFRNKIIGNRIVFSYILKRRERESQRRNRKNRLSHWLTDLQLNSDWREKHGFILIGWRQIPWCKATSHWLTDIQLNSDWGEKHCFILIGGKNTALFWLDDDTFSDVRLSLIGWQTFLFQLDPQGIGLHLFHYNLKILPNVRSRLETWNIFG